MGVLSPLVMALDAACLAGSGKQEVLGGRDEGLVTPVAGAAGEAGMLGSPSLPSLGSQILASWPNPAHWHRAFPTLNPYLQQWLPGEKRMHLGGGAPPPRERPAQP